MAQKFVKIVGSDVDVESTYWIENGITVCTNEDGDQSAFKNGKQIIEEFDLLVTKFIFNKEHTGMALVPIKEPVAAERCL